MGIGTSAIEAGRAYVRLYTDSSEYVKGLRGAEAKLKAFANNIGSLGARMTAFASMAALPIALSAKTFANFQDQMLAVKAAAGATADEFQRLYDQAKKLGATTSFTAAEVGAGQLGLAKAGFGPAEIEAAIPAVLNLARATGTELATATEIATGSLRAFNLEAKEMPRVVDVLTAAANASDAGIEDIGEAMKIAAPVAKEYGLTLEQTAKSLGVLANLQIKGTMAGTSLRQIMLQLADPKVQERLRGMGIEVLDASKNLRPLGDVMVEIGKKMAGLGTGERLALGKELFDQRAISAGLVLSTHKFDALSDAIDKAAGIADRTAKIMDSGLGGAFRIMMSAIEGVQIAIGESLTQLLTRWGTTVTDAADAVRKWIDEHKQLVVGITVLITAVGAFGAALAALGIAASGIAGLAGLAAMLTSAWPVILGVGAAVAAAAAACVLWGRDIKATLMPAFDAIAKAWKDVQPVLSDLGDAFRRLLADAQPLLDKFGEAVVADVWLFVASIEAAADAVGVLAGAYQRLKQLGFGAAAMPGPSSIAQLNTDAASKLPTLGGRPGQPLANMPRLGGSGGASVVSVTPTALSGSGFLTDKIAAEAEANLQRIQQEQAAGLVGFGDVDVMTEMRDAASAAADAFQSKSFSSFSAEQAFRTGLGTKTDTAAEKTAKATEETATGVGFLVKGVENVRQAILSGGKMTG